MGLVAASILVDQQLAGRRIYGGDRGRRASWDSEASQASVENVEAADPQAAAPVGGDGDSTTTATSAADRHAWRPWHSYSWYSWTYEDDWYYMWNRNAWTPSENGDRQGPDLVELLPDYVQGWYLLHDANLDVSERNIIQTALRGDYSLQRVAQELRSQWPEAELRRRDHGSRQGGYFGVEDEEENPEDETYGNYDESILVAEGMNEEGLQAMQEANREAYDAWAVIQGARRTLKEARARQKYVKLSRKYYSPSSKPGATPRRSGPGGSSTSSSSRSNPDANMVCLNCGRTGHRAAHCPDKKADANFEEEQAPFVCYADREMENQESFHINGRTTGTEQDSRMLTTTEAIARMGVIDGGATKTLASVQALEALMRKNQDLRGDTGIQEVDTEVRPVFSFGNSSSNRCLSTAHMSISAGGKPGIMKIHTIDAGHGPLLISIEALRSLKAIIDFSTDQAVFRNISDKHVVQLQRSATGHQLLPMTNDLLAHSQVANRAIPSLQSFLSTDGPHAAA